MLKSASEDDVFSAIGGMEISSKREAEGNAAALAASAPPLQAATQSSAAAAAPAASAVSNAIPDSRSTGSLSGSGGGAGGMATSPGGGGFTVGPSIGDLPQDETPSRTLFVRNLEPSTEAAEIRRTFEVCFRMIHALHPAKLPAVVRSPLPAIPAAAVVTTCSAHADWTMWQIN